MASVCSICGFPSDDADLFNTHMREHEPVHESPIETSDLVRESIEYNASVAGVLSRLDFMEDAFRDVAREIQSLHATVSTLVARVNALEAPAEAAANTTATTVTE